MYGVKRSVLLLIIIALVVRILIFTVMLRDPSSFLTPDSIVSYIPIARNIVHHGVFSSFLYSPYYPDTIRTPVYPSFLAILLFIFGSITVPAVLAQIVFSLISIYLVYRLGSMMYSERVGLVAGYLYSFDPASLALTFLVLTETLFVTLLLLSLFFFLKSLESSNFVKILITGFLFGITILTRPIAVFFPIILAFFLLRTKKPILKIALFLSACALTVSPWILRNNKVTGRPVLSTIVHINMLNYNATLLLATLRSYEFHNIHVDPYLNALRDSLNMEAEKISLKRKVPLFKARFKIAEDIIFDHPIDYLLLHLKGTLETLFIPGSGLLLERLGLKITGTGIVASLMRGDLKRTINVLKKRGAVLLLPFLELFYIVFVYTLSIVGFFKRKNIYALILLLVFIYFVLIPGPVISPRFRAVVFWAPIILASLSLKKIKFKDEEEYNFTLHHID